jgi:hypothetical protein
MFSIALLSQYAPTRIPVRIPMPMRVWRTKETVKSVTIVRLIAWELRTVPSERLSSSAAAGRRMDMPFWR